MIEASISADVVDSTSLSAEDSVRLVEYLRVFIDRAEVGKTLTRYSSCWGRLVRGDGVEFVVYNERDVMRLALALKVYVKTFNVKEASSQFKRSGIRVAVGIGGLRTNDREHGIIDGTAIYNSGRALEGMSQTGFDIVTPYRGSACVLKALFRLVDALIVRATARQCEVLYLRLQNMSEREIAMHFNITPVAVWAHLTKVGWRAIESALECFEHMDFSSGVVK